MIFFLIVVIINIPVYTILGGTSSGSVSDISTFFERISIGRLDTNFQSCSSQNMAKSSQL